MNENDKQLWSKFDAASRKIKECKVNDNSAESEYSKAYQNLVKAGLALQIRKKYR